MRWVQDHEGLYEASRMKPAVGLAVAIVILAVMLTATMARRLGASWQQTTPGQLAIAGLVAATVGAAAGVVPRQTGDGTNICGPVMNLGRADNSACSEVLNLLSATVVVALTIAVVLSTASFVLMSSDQTIVRGEG